MSNFGDKLFAATEMLATGRGNCKTRLMLAVVNELVFANMPEDDGIPIYFRSKCSGIVDELSTNEFDLLFGEDRIRETIKTMSKKTAAIYARRIWDLYNEFFDYEKTGAIPESPFKRQRTGFN
jgi:hypothetical protein